jgi:transcriptional regulator with XRE-family HTH domain
MNVGERLKELRESKDLSQGDIEKRTGLLRCYVSRVENLATVPSIETLEKFARALEIPLYQIFYDGNEKPPAENVARSAGESWGTRGADARTLSRFRRLLGRTSPGDQKLLFHMASKMAARKRRTASA